MTGITAAFAGLNIAGRLSGVSGALKAVPRWVWYVIAAAALLAGGYLYHGHRVHRHDAALITAEDARISKQALALKAKVDALTAKIAITERNRNDEQNRLIAADAGAIRVLGPGKAVCPGRISAPSAAGGSVAPGRPSDAAGPQVPADDLAAVPWGWLTDSAEQADLNRAEVLSWRSWYARLVAAWPSAAPQPR